MSETEFEVDIALIERLTRQWKEQKIIAQGANEMAQGYAKQLKKALGVGLGESRRAVTSHGTIEVASAINYRADRELMANALAEHPDLAEVVAIDYRFKKKGYDTATPDIQRLADTVFESREGTPRVTLKD